VEGGLNMPKHVVSQGECLSSIASRYGLKSWRDLYEHADNAELKQKRANPNVLAPGDEVHVPDAPAQWTVRSTEKRHRFVVPARTVKLRIQLRDTRGEPCSGKRFVVNVGEREIEGKTCGESVIEVDVPATASSARLRVWLHDDEVPNIDRLLAIGHLDPHCTLHGVEARLSNLGFACPTSGDPPSGFDDPTIAAVRAFRAAHGLPAIAEPEEEGADAAAHLQALMDDAFRAKLDAEYAKRGSS
jgi:hypothetical protein